jgi:tetratricopeptide (TPR) repeat protein
LAIRHVAWDLARYTSDDIKIARARRLLLAEAAHGDVEGVQALGDFLADHDPDSAVEVWERLHAMGVGRAAYELASVYRRRRDAAEAERWFRVAIDADEDWTDEAAADFGCLLLEQGRRQEAEPLLRRSWNGDLHLAWLLESRGDDDEALEVYGRLVEQDDDQSAAKAGLARIHRRRGDRDEAAFWWEQAEEAGAEPELPPFAR